ncbi:hypothetical protein D5125_17130 [Magnetovirga frankeli]|uniref:hypothetical protein n=1 Tax=Magnetovirga frankeli TaxID=947516 RepID=UPI001293DD88|nr:hypothetical protein D5125_17130 [gamma proteobacterium SS-5]
MSTSELRKIQKSLLLLASLELRREKDQARIKNIIARLRNLEMELIVASNSREAAA